MGILNPSYAVVLIWITLILESREAVPTCGYFGCDAASLGGGLCLGHAKEDELNEAILRWRYGAPLDGRQAYIDADRLALLLSVMSKGDSALQAQPFQEDYRPAFCGRVMFDQATFATDVDFGGILFEGPVSFDGARFCGDSRFSQATFNDHADFDDARFEGILTFRGSIFRDHAGFQNAIAKNEVVFASAVFEENVDLEGASFKRGADFREASFKFARILGPLSIDGYLNLDDCVFSERVRLEVAAQSISANFAIFVEGGRLAVAGADVELAGTSFGRATTLSQSVDLDLDRDRVAALPKLLTLRGAQVSSLSISRVDLSDCRFFEAHGLESVVIEPSCKWRRPPARWRCIDREMILEEYEWRSFDESSLHSREGRLRRLLHPSLWSNSTRSAGKESEILRPEQLAALYRALRKAREDNKDQAGAGDLYYGEMEMRRRTELPSGRGKIRAMSDRAVIASYWLVSGYGLRASRAFLVWASVVVLAGAALLKWGITPTPSLGRAMLFSGESTSSLVRLSHLPDGYSLTPAGEIVQLWLRIIGPLLIGLLLLALRSRVKR